MKLYNVVYKYFKREKKNTLIILLSIIVSTAMFLTVNIVSEDRRILMIENAKEENGDYHSVYVNPNNEQVNYILNEDNIKYCGIEKLLGVHSINNQEILKIAYFDENYRDQVNININLLEGELPKNKNEIALTDWHLKKINMDNPIGQEIQFEYRNNTTKELMKTTFKITGIISSDPVEKAKGTALGYVTEETVESNSGGNALVSRIMFRFKDESNVNAQIDQLIVNAKLQEDNIEKNQDLIYRLGDSNSVKLPFYIINLIIIFVTVLLIHNIMSILIAKRNKDYGILRAIGFVPNDVRKLLILESTIYAIIAIPIGLILGGILSNIVRKYLFATMYDISSLKNNISTTVWLYISTAILASITIILSIIKPLIDASNVDPMIVIRATAEKINIKANSKFNRIISKFCSDKINIAIKNMIRNKKRTTITITSMTIIGIMIIVMYSSFTNNVLTGGEFNNWIKGEYLISGVDYWSLTDNKVMYSEELVKKLEDSEGISEILPVRCKTLKAEATEQILNKQSDSYKNDPEKYETNITESKGEKIYNISLNSFGVDNISVFEDNIIEGREYLQDFEERNYVYIEEEIKDIIDIKKGDLINIKFVVDTEEGRVFNDALGFVVAGFITEGTIANRQSSSKIDLFMHTAQFNKVVGYSGYERIDIWTDKDVDQEYIENKLKNIVEEAGVGEVLNFKNEFEKIEISNKKTEAMTLIFATLLGILAVTNIYTTISTNIMGRRREFFLYNAVGITKGEIRDISVIEGSIYGTVSLIISVIIGLIVRSILISEFVTEQLIDTEMIVVLIITALILILSGIISTIISLYFVNKSDNTEFLRV